MRLSHRQQRRGHLRVEFQGLSDVPAALAEAFVFDQKPSTAHVQRRVLQPVGLVAFGGFAVLIEGFLVAALRLEGPTHPVAVGAVVGLVIQHALEDAHRLFVLALLVGASAHVK